MLYLLMFIDVQAVLYSKAIGSEREKTEKETKRGGREKLVPP